MRSLLGTVRLSKILTCSKDPGVNRQLVQRGRRVGEVGVGLPVRIATAPFEHGQGVGEDDILLDLGPAHADAGVTA